MITSIVLKDIHKIGINSSGKFAVNDVSVSIKEVPFVRYRFTQYGEKEINYIREMQKVFVNSAHMAEVMLNDNSKEVLESLNNIHNLIKFCYISIDDFDAMSGIGEHKLNIIKGIKESNFNRFMIKDNSSTLDPITAHSFKKKIASVLEIDADSIGMCSSPFSKNEREACLTAVKARELSAEYTENEEVALPSSSHECMDRCGCIRYHIFNYDVAAPISSSCNVKVKEKSSGTVETKSKGILRW